ncbi:MAG: sigma-54 dependent transcriptional regulator, partial [Acidobacteriota bacterium]
DVMLGDADGSQLVAELRSRLSDVPVIMITRSASVEAAVRCMKHGAADYITKPLDFGRLEQAIRTALEVAAVNRRSRGELAPRQAPFHGLVGDSPAMRRLFHLIETVAPADVSALILGETGTGKELVARAIHQLSQRRDEPFVPVNAAAIPHDLIESELFGHERGAFTGASQAHVGFCEQADGGTLFLDEIGEMGFDVQVKLLRFLQDHQVQRVGSRKTRRVDVRVLAATNIDPRRQIAQRKLREDLYYRLRVVSLSLPPLRERGGDVTRLAEHFMQRAAVRHQRQLTRLTPAAAKSLSAYPWPGNVRELENVIEEAVVLHQGVELTPEMLPAEVRQIEPESHGMLFQDPVVTGGPASAGSSASAGVAASTPQLGPGGEHEARLSRRELEERHAVADALARHHGEIEDAARELGISRATIYRRIKKYGLPGRRS